MLSVESIHKQFGAIRAVNGLSFSLQRGEIVGLLGPNGAGKTTTMRIITGFFPANQGRVSLDGVDVADDPIAARRQIGYLPENCPLYDDMEVAETLIYMAKLRGVPADRLHARVKEVIGMCGLGDVVGRKTSTFSKGYRQRVGIAQALIHSPQLLVLDEPTNGLDPNQVVEIRNLIKELGRSSTVIVSTHIMREVEAVCDRAMIMHRGNVVASGTLTELADAQRGEAMYHVAIRAPKEAITDKLSSLASLAIQSCDEEGKWSRCVLTGQSTDDESETLFNWVVANGWMLRELRRESTSLENVFHQLTQEER